MFSWTHADIFHRSNSINASRGSPVSAGSSPSGPGRTAMGGEVARPSAQHRHATEASSPMVSLPFGNQAPPTVPEPVRVRLSTGGTDERERLGVLTGLR